MKAAAQPFIDIEIDELTNSIVHATSGEVMQTAVERATAADLRTTTKKAGWRFGWLAEAREPKHEVFKLTLLQAPTVIQGLVSSEDRDDHLYMHLIESAPVNFGKRKQYIGVPGNLVAYVCKRAFELGYEGNVSFRSKTQLIEHYTDSLGATHVGNHTMIIYPFDAAKLVTRYFSQFKF